ncbi:MAG: calcium-binding protein, partial [Selenomonadaceae bacterium]|nr:calcium-binding protein [Selenomonadaceae bacterium]
MNTVNTKSDTLISGTSSADSIQNASGAVNVTLEGLAGNDTLKNWGASASINAGAGNDYIYNDAAKSIILGGKGNDSVTNWGDNVTINGGADADSLINGADKVIIFADTGADTVINQGNDVSISAVSGNNFFANIGASVTIAGGTDSDTLNNQGSNVSIDSGAGNDSIQNIGSTVKISLADGDDKINNFASSVTISGGKGSDSIGNWSGSNKVSISAGAGDDSIYNNGGNKVTINGDSGNDSIYNFYATVKINGGSDNDYIYNAASSVTINGSSGKDTVDNRSNKVSVNGGSGDDSLTNEGAKATILGGDGNDTITNKTALYATDEGGTRTVSPDNVSINGGKGNDLLINTGGANVRLGGGKLVSLNGGEGNDTLTGSTNAEVFVYDSGNDVITNYSGEDTVKIAAGSIDSYYTDNADLIFMIGDGSLTLKDMQGRYITITDSSGNTTTQLYGSTGYSAQDAIKNLVQAWNKTFLSKTDKLDESIKLSTNFNGIQDAIDQMVADCKAAGDADTFLRKYCGIILDNADTGAITGWDAGGSSIKTGDNIVGETLSSLQKVPDYSDTTFTARNLRINIASTGSSLNADGKKTFDGLYSWWADEALKLVEESYGVSFSNGDSIRVEMVPSASYAGNTSSNGVVKLNQSGIKFDSDDDYNGNGIDRTIAHEFTHVAQNLFMGYFPQFLEEGLADLTQGIDDSGKRQWIESLAANADSLATYLDLDASGTGNIPYYAAGYMFYRYLTRQAAVNFNDSADYAWKDNILISGTEDADLLTGSG